MPLIITLFMTFFITQSSHASYQVSLAWSHITRTANYEINNEVKSEETRNPMEIKLGNLMNNKIYLGAIYNLGSRTVTSASTTRTEKLTAYGGTVGYDPGDWYIHFSYYLSAELDTDSNIVFKEGSGFQLDIGKKFRWGSIFIVPQLAYSSLSFKIRDSNGTEADVSSSDFGGIIPQVAFMYEF